MWLKAWAIASLRGTLFRTGRELNQIPLFHVSQELVGTLPRLIILSSAGLDPSRTLASFS